MRYQRETIDVQSGIQYQHKQHRHNYAYDWNPDDPLDPDTNMQSMVAITETDAVGVYASIDYVLTERFKIVGALRADKTSILEDDTIYLSPRVAANYEFTQHWKTKLLYNKATKMPDPWQSPLNQIFGVDNPAAPAWAATNSLADKPETFTSYEWQNIFYVGSERRSRLMVVAYYQQLEDYISWYHPFTNIGDFEGHGVELSLNHPLTSRLNLVLNGAYSENDFDISATQFGERRAVPVNNNGEVLAAPKYTANLIADYELAENTSLNIGVRYFTQQPTFGVKANRYTYINNQWYVDVAMSWRHLVFKGLVARISIENVLDNQEPIGAQWREIMYRPRGASYLVSIGYQF